MNLIRMYNFLTVIFSLIYVGTKTNKTDVIGTQLYISCLSLLTVFQVKFDQ